MCDVSRFSPRVSFFPLVIFSLRVGDENVRKLLGKPTIIDNQRACHTEATPFELLAQAPRKVFDPIGSVVVDESEAGPHFRVMSLEGLARVKLTAFRDKDRVHLRDLIDIGLIDATWLVKLPPELQTRLQSLLDTPGR